MKKNNPIIEKLIFLIQNGKQIGRIHPEFTSSPDKKVTFHLSDGTEEELQTKGSHNAFMSWWRSLDAFIKIRRKLQGK